MNERCELIAYWLMGKDLCEHVIDDYHNNKRIIEAIKNIEDNPKYPNVGRFSHPNEEGIIQLDAGWMEGNSKVGAVIETSHIVNPIEVAYSLSSLNQNNILCADGADKYAQNKGFETKDELEICEADKDNKSHDTFGVISLVNGHFSIGITTSGRKGKTKGRVGDTPLIGSGFYAEDHIGAAILTGDGEACFRSVMAKEAVDRLMLGENIKGLAFRVLERGLSKLDYETELSIIVVDKDGKYDVASTFDVFPYSYINNGKIYNRYLYQNIEYEHDEKLHELYHGD